MPGRVVTKHPAIVLAATLAGILLAGTFVARTIANARTTTSICAKIDLLDAALVGIVQNGAAAPKPGEYGYDYWLHHPAERASRGQGVERAVLALRKASCDPNHLPAVRLSP